MFDVVVDKKNFLFFQVRSSSFVLQTISNIVQNTLLIVPLYTAASAATLPLLIEERCIALLFDYGSPRH